MRIVITPHRETVILQKNQEPSTPAEKSAQIAAGRAEMTRKLMRRFPQAKVLGILGKGEILVDLPDSEPNLPSRIRESLGVETGPDPGAPPTGPVWNELQPTREAIERTYLEGLFRPTVVAMVRDEARRLLMVQATRNGEWGVVQGGIEEHETPLEALARELREEIDVGAEFYAPKTFVGCADIHAPPRDPDLLKFPAGLRYFIFEVAYVGSGEMRLQKEELSAYEWVSSRFDDPRLLDLLRQARPAKRDLIIGALIRLM